MHMGVSIAKLCMRTTKLSVLGVMSLEHMIEIPIIRILRVHIRQHVYMYTCIQIYCVQNSSISQDLLIILCNMYTLNYVVVVPLPRRSHCFGKVGGPG